ncbi:hypothetical protein MMC26_005003 [Xylographa opegraphella]|nr:hypothetical protein [Xylographa opegraphella]
MKPGDVTSLDEDANANMTKSVSHQAQSSPASTTSLPIRVGHEAPHDTQTEESELLTEPDNNEDSMQELDAISLLQEASLQTSTLSDANIIDTREFQEDLFQGLPARRTRATTKKLAEIANAELPSPKKDRDEVEGSWDNLDDDTYVYEAPEQRKEDFVDNDDTSCSDTCLDLYVTKVTPSRIPKRQDPSPIMQESSARETEKRQAWDDWIRRKQETKGLLALTKYGIPSSHGHEYEVSQVPALTELEHHGIYSVEQRVCVLNFKYNDLAFSDFARKFPLYLELLEEAAGRDCGVVKIILPRLSGGTRRPTEALNPDQLLCTRHSKSMKKVTNHGDIDMYEVNSKGQKNVKYTSSRIQLHASASVKSGFDFDRKEREFLARMQMAQSSSSYTMKTANEFNMARIRYALGLNTVELSKLPNETPKERLSTAPSTDSAQIHVAQSEGVVCGMRINKSAAYSISYLHKGAAKVWTVVKPFEHVKFEEIMHMVTSPDLVETEQGTRPHFPPQCDKFLDHKRLYVPGPTLEAFGVVYRQVVQEQNEMIIIFPYAYHQAYDIDANISQEMSYSTKRSDNFLTRDLYRQCGPTCSPNSIQSQKTAVQTIPVQTTPVQTTSVQGGYGSLLRRRQLSSKEDSVDKKAVRQRADSARVAKRKLDDYDTTPIPRSSERSARKKRTLVRGLPRGGDEVQEVLEQIDHEFAGGCGKNV